MGYKLSDIEEGTTIILTASNNENQINLLAVVKKQVKKHIILVSIPAYSNRQLKFDNVQIDVLCNQDNDTPILWRNVNIINYQNDYIIQATSEGMRNNRRGSFRVPVAVSGTMQIMGSGYQTVLVKDVSVSGFALSDRKNELTHLSIGDIIAVVFDDLGYHLTLSGRLVRTEEREDITIYGFEIVNLCKDLAPYINAKQRYVKKPRLS